MWGETNNAFQVDLLFVKVLFLNYGIFVFLDFRLSLHVMLMLRVPILQMNVSVKFPSLL